MQYNKGDRVRLVSSMLDDPDPIPVGSEATVIRVVDLGEFIQLGVDWDNGRTLGLVIPPDRVIVIERAPDES